MTLFHAWGERVPRTVARTRMMCAAFGLFVLASAVTVSAQTLVERGEYVLRAAGCVACHTDIENDGKYLAGGVEFNTPFGIFYSPNITAHPDHGIGKWSLDDLTGALTRGEGPGGVHYYPVFPYTAYSGMRPEDFRALFAYLQTVPDSLQALTKMIGTAFKENAKPTEDVMTRAKPNIWQNWSDFEKKTDDLVKAVAAYAATARAGDKQMMAAKLDGVWDVCKGCHIPNTIELVGDTLLIADSGNDRIARYKLTFD